VDNHCTLIAVARQELVDCTIAAAFKD